MKKKLLKSAMAFLLCAAMVLPLAGCGNEDVVEEATKTKMVVEDAADAITKLAEAAEDYGYENAFSELTEKRTTTVDGDSYYRLQQNYQGIPVYGKTVVCVTDEDGNVTSVTDNAEDVDETIDVVPTVTEEQVTESLQTYLTEVYEIKEVDDVTIGTLSEASLCIYNEEGESLLVYVVPVYSYEAVVDAHNAEVLQCSQVFVSNTSSNTMAQSTSNSMAWRDTDGTYILRDSVRNIYIYDAGKETYWNPQTGARYPQVLTLVRSEDSVFGDKNDNTKTSKKAVEYLKALSAVYDYYQTNHRENGYGVLAGVYNDAVADYNGKNAGGGIVDINWLPSEPPGYDREQYHACIGLITMGTKHCKDFDKSIDILGHEYTHFVSRKHASWNYDAKTNLNLQTGAIDEGLSDIFGELIESDYKSNNKNKTVAPNWKHDNRNMKNPSKNGYPATVTDENNGGEDFTHGYSTVISHAAYLMWNGIDGTDSKKLSTDELGELWYRAMLLMASDCNFQECRKLVELAARDMELTDEKIACVAEAFDEVGIYDSTFAVEVSEDAVYEVLDKEGEVYGNYTFYAARVEQDEEIADQLLSQDVDLAYIVENSVACRPISSTMPQAIDLDAGIYVIAVVDNANHENRDIRTIWVKESGGGKKLSIQTDWRGIDAEVSADAVYEVLDIDGNAYGDYTFYAAAVDSNDEVDLTYIVEHYAACRPISSTETQAIDLDAGVYAIAVVDNANHENQDIRTIWVKESGGAKTLTIATDWEKMNYRYKAYADKITEYESIYGLVNVYPEGESGFMVAGSCMTGLCFMKLVDFNQTGQEELLLVYQTVGKAGNITYPKYTFEIWGFPNGELALMDTGELFGTDGGVQHICLTEYNGKTYLVTGSTDDFGYYYYHGYADGTFGIVRTVEWEWDMSGEYKCSIDGKTVTYDAIQAEQNKWLESESRYILNFDCDDILEQNEVTKQQLSPYYVTTTDSDTSKDVPKTGQAVLISEEEAYAIASDYWGNAIDPENGIYLVSGGLKTKDNEQYYAFSLQWTVDDGGGRSHLSTIDFLNVDAKTGECSDGFNYP